MLMALSHFVLPTGLGGVDGQKTDEVLRVGCNVVGDVFVRNPGAAEFGFAAEDDGAEVIAGLLGGGNVVFPTNGEIDLDAGSGELRLLAFGFAVVDLIVPGVGVDVDDHSLKERGGRIEEKGVRRLG